MCDNQNPREFLFFGSPEYQTSIGDFLLPNLCELFPRIEKEQCGDHPAFLEYLINRYGIMYRETQMRCLKNKARQRRAFKRYFLDLQILINDGSFADEVVSSDI